MQLDINAIVVSLLSAATISGAVAWLIKSLAEKALDVGIERYKQTLDLETGRQKAQLELTHQLLLHEYTPRFEVLAERRAKIISELYTGLLRAARALDKDYQMRSIHRVTGEPGEDQNQQINDVRQTHEAAHREASNIIEGFADYFDENRIFFSSSLCKRVETFLQVIQTVYGRLEYGDWYRREKPHPSWPTPKFNAEQWNTATDQANRVRAAIEEEFRALLGVSQAKLSEGNEV